MPQLINWNIQIYDLGMLLEQIVKGNPPCSIFVLFYYEVIGIDWYGLLCQQARGEMPAR
jgi:hypothetical protein